VFRNRIPARLFAGLLIPPVLIVGVLTAMAKLVSPTYAPNFFPLGLLFGLPAGFFEEIGWTGFAFPRMAASASAFGRSVVLGVLWASWHLPVVNYLGTASPHGRYWLAYFLVFAIAMTAMRVLICWLYANSKSVLIAQFMHMSSTGSLVVFSAAGVSAAQEVLWYAVYGALLWGWVAIVLGASGRGLRVAGQRDQQLRQAETME
jgi:membrane protease YdiL (CAAX protease family)